MTSKLYRILSLPAILMASFAAFGCESEESEEHHGRTVEIVAEEYRFTPSQITAEPGERLTITLRNRGKMEHSIEFDLPGPNEALERNVVAGTTAHMSLTAPSKPGSYSFFSPLGDDRKRGLEGRLDVISRGSKR